MSDDGQPLSLCFFINRHSADDDDYQLKSPSGRRLPFYLLRSRSKPPSFRANGPGWGPAQRPQTGWLCQLQQLPKEHSAPWEDQNKSTKTPSYLYEHDIGLGV